jgi:hypothetical protein
MKTPAFTLNLLLLLSKVFSLRTGFTYERLDTDYKVTGNSYNFHAFIIDVLYRYDYISIPMLARASFGNKVRFWINGGPYFSYLCNQEYALQNGSYSGSYLISKPYTGNKNTKGKEKE